MCNTVDVGCAIEADGVVFHIGSHLGAGMDAGLDRVCAGDEESARPLLRHDVAADGEHGGPGATIGRSIESWRSSTSGSTATRGSASASTRAICTRPAAT